MVPRIRRAVEGVGQTAVLTDDQMRDLTADALAAVILYTGSAFGKELLVTSYAAGNVPEEYSTSDALTLPEQTVVATQAALDHFFRQFSDAKVSETIADEAQNWSYTLSSTLIKDRLAQLMAERDRALEALMEADTTGLDAYSSFLAVRDHQTAMAVEPWLSALSNVGGLQIEELW